MKIYFHKGTNWKWTPTRLDNEQNMLALSFNNWDDYGIGTSLNAALYFDSEKFAHRINEPEPPYENWE